MKALTFQEFYGKTIQQKVDYYDYWYAGQKEKSVWNTGVKRPHNDKLRIDLDNWYHKLTSQPFKPELITELFEGWVTDAQEADEIPYSMFSKKDNRDPTFIEFGEYQDDGFYTLSNNDINCMDLIIQKPDTLERFISNCQQAGIELQFKEVTK